MSSSCSVNTSSVEGDVSFPDDIDFVTDATVVLRRCRNFGHKATQSFERFLCFSTRQTSGEDAEIGTVAADMALAVVVDEVACGSLW